MDRALHPAAVARRGRPRQGFAVAAHARRRLEQGGRRTIVAGLHVGAPGQADAVHGRRVRPGGGVGRVPLAGVARSSTSRCTPASCTWSATSTRTTARRRRSTPPTADPRASNGSTPATSPAMSSASCGSARTARRWPASPTSPGGRITTIASGCRRPVPGGRSSTPTARSTAAPASATSAQSRPRPRRGMANRPRRCSSFRRPASCGSNQHDSCHARSRARAAHLRT